MRRAGICIVVAWALAGATAAAAPAPAPAGTATLAPATAGAGSHLLLDAAGNAGAGFHPREVPSGLAIALQPGFAFDPTAVAGVCSDTQAKNQQCPPNSIVGTGILDVLAEGYAFGPSGQHFTAQLTFFRANPRQAGDAAGIVFAFKETSSGFDGATIGRLQDSDDPAFGREIRWDKLPIPALPPGMHFTLQRLRVDLGAGAATPPVRVAVKHKSKPHCRRVWRHTKSGHRYRVWLCCRRVTRHTKSGRKYTVRVCRRHRHRPTARSAQATSGRAFLTNPVSCTGAWHVRLEVTYATGVEQRDADAPCTAR